MSAWSAVPRHLVHTYLNTKHVTSRACICLFQVHWLRGADNHWRFACIKAAVESARSLNFPDSAFIVNIDDFPICQEGRCPLPVFTNYKKWRNGQNLDTNEVLFPVSIWQRLTTLGLRVSEPLLC